MTDRNITFFEIPAKDRKALLNSIKVSLDGKQSILANR